MKTHREILILGVLFILIAHQGGVKSKSTLSDHTNRSVGYKPDCLAIGDMNCDGFNDIVTADSNSETLSLYLFNSTEGEFEPKYTLAAGSEPRAVAIGDMDNDGDNDLICANRGDDTLGLYIFNRTSGTLGASNVTIITGNNVHPESLVIGDVDDDGRSEAVVGLTGSDEVMVVRWNVTEGNWTGVQRFIVPAHPCSMALGNLTGDRYPDLAVAASNEDKVRIYKGGKGGFSFLEQLDGGDSPYAVDLGDLDGDGDDDVAIASNKASNITYYYNLGSGFGDKQRIACGGSPWDVEIGDYNNDGYNDMLSVSGQKLELNLFRYDLDLLTFIDDGWRQTGRYPRDVEVADIDGDGDNDTVVINKNDHSISIYTANSHPEFLRGDGEYTINEGVDSSELFIDLFEHFSDREDDVQELSFSVTAFDQVNNYSTSIKNDRYLTFDCKDSVDFNGNMTVVARATDTGSDHSDGSFVIRVLPLPDPPVFLKIGNVSVYQQNPIFYLYEHAWYNTTITAGDPDGDKLTFSSNITEPTAPEYVERFHLNESTGNISFRPEKADIGNNYARFTVTDTTGLSSHLSVLFVVRDVNDPPVLQGLNDRVFEDGTPHFTAVEGFWFNITVKADDPEKDTLRYYIKGAPANMNMDSLTGLITFLPAQNDIDEGPNYTVEVRIEDDAILNDSAAFTISIIDVNMAPRIEKIHISPASREEGYGVGEKIILGVDSMDPDGDEMNISWHISGTDAPFGFGTNSTYTLMEEGDLIIEVIVVDWRGKSNSMKVDLVVHLFNKDPVITVTDKHYAYAGREYSVQYEGKDAEGDEIRWEMETNCTWLSITDLGMLSGTVPEGDVGKYYRVLIIVSDERGGKKEREFTLLIKSEEAIDDDGGNMGKTDNEKNGKMIYGIAVIGALALAGGCMTAIFMAKKKRLEKEREGKEEEEEEEYAEIIDPNRKISCPSCGMELQSMDDKHSRECPNCGFERW